ncbi:hypothetical protein PSN13_06836 [Micromonospora saelicesensis]|uniref:PknH-like extracellular domain-containing protein n=1 Tax=Micromonospora saelicesensis TaxID=285676 RepID=A0A328NCZ4_9ACTN|nr:hypothetical protein [Micromonospora saelicesensis]RAO26806.1 hypothetical protein PSN13_06836 [Micromonospora saelicesensis]
MRDDPTFVEQIQRDLRDVRWLGPEEIRSRARRRSQRKVVVATVVLALAGVSAVAVAAPRKSPPPVLPAAAPSASPTRHEITTDALLQPADLPQQVDVQLSQSGLGEPVLLDHLLDACRTSQGRSDGRQYSILSRSQTLVPKRAAAILTQSDGLLTQDLYRLTPDAAIQLLATMDDLVAPCAEWNSIGGYKVGGATGTGSATHRWAVVQRDFAGDGAALLRHTGSQPVDQKTGEPIGAPPRPSTTAVVRVGDLITVLNLGQTGTELDLRRLAAVAARRMCAAANPAC